MLDLMTNFRYGGGYLDSLINMESFKNSAAYCDELIWVDDGTTAEYKKRFTLGLVVDWQASLIDITDQIRMACRGYVASRNGQVSFLNERPTEVVQDFTMDHIVPNSL
jgi:predicted phage tail protein